MTQLAAKTLPREYFVTCTNMMLQETFFAFNFILHVWAA